MPRLLCLLLSFGVARIAAGQVALELQPGDVVLDVDGDRALIGRRAAAPEASDPALRMAVRYVVRGVAVPAPGLGEWVGQARLLPGGRALATAEDGTLLEVDLATGRTLALDRGAEGAIGASPDGRHLVYCKGESPDLEVVSLDRTTGQKRAVTRDMAPTWSPAVSPDGRSVVFASAKSGAPAIWRVDDGGAPRQVTKGGDFPDALGPTLYAGGFIAFEMRGRVVVLGSEGRKVKSLAGASAPHWIGPGRTLGVVVKGRVVHVALLGGRP